MTDKYRITWIATICLIIAWGVADGALALLGQPTVSQMAYYRAREDAWIFWAVCAFSIWLPVHLLWRWKNLWRWIKEKL